MDIRRSFHILELHYGATEAEARQAYKDMVSVWHPDRFCNNPRLKRRAEEKLQEINAAYETIRDFLKNRQSEGPDHEIGSSGSRTELIAEIGTGVVLGLCSFISGKFRGMFMEKDHIRD